MQEEVLVDEHDDGTLELIATPAFVLGVAAGDRVRLDASGTFVVLERGGNLAIQVFADHHAANDLASEFRELGGRIDGRATNLTVFTVPVSAGFPRVEAVLNRFLERHPTAEWYFGNVYAEDGATPLNWWT